jgi:hypothetical protein
LLRGAHDRARSLVLSSGDQDDPGTSNVRQASTGTAGTCPPVPPQASARQRRRRCWWSVKAAAAQLDRIVKGGVIEIQGDHRNVVVEILKAEGYTPVLAGG